MKYQKINLLLVQYKVFIYMLLLLSYSTYSMQEETAEKNIERVLEKNTEKEPFILMVEKDRQKKSLNSRINKIENELIKTIEKKNEDTAERKIKRFLISGAVGSFGFYHLLFKNNDNPFNFESNFLKQACKTIIGIGSFFSFGILGSKLCNDELSTEIKNTEDRWLIPLFDFNDLDFDARHKKGFWKKCKQIITNLFSRSTKSIQDEIINITGDDYLQLLKKNTIKIDADDINMKNNDELGIIKNNFDQEIYLNRLQENWERYQKIIFTQLQNQIKYAGWLFCKEVAEKANIISLFKLIEWREPEKVYAYLSEFKEDETEIILKNNIQKEKDSAIENIRKLLFKLYDKEEKKILLDETQKEFIYERIRDSLTFNGETALGRCILSPENKEDGTDFKEMSYDQFKKQKIEFDEKKESMVLFEKLKKDIQDFQDINLPEYIKTFINNEKNKYTTSENIYNYIKEAEKKRG